MPWRKWEVSWLEWEVPWWWEVLCVRVLLCVGFFCVCVGAFGAFVCAVGMGAGMFVCTSTRT